MTITGLPKHLENYSLAIFEYFATGEGVTTEVELLSFPGQKPTIGWEGLSNNIIPAVIERKETMYEKEHVWLEWNPEFKAAFFDNFGVGDWMQFHNCCVKHGSWMNLVKKAHYNLS
jgi:hypothetical protein